MVLQIFTRQPFCIRFPCNAIDNSLEPVSKQILRWHEIRYIVEALSSEVGLPVWMYLYASLYPLDIQQPHLQRICILYLFHPCSCVDLQSSVRLLIGCSGVPYYFIGFPFSPAGLCSLAPAKLLTGTEQGNREPST